MFGSVVLWSEGRVHGPYWPIHPAVRRLAAETTALKDASRRAIARWPRKNEAILDRGGLRRLEMFRPGRENATLTEPENVVVARRLAKAGTNTSNGIFTPPRAVNLHACGGHGPRAESECAQFPCLRGGVQSKGIAVTSVQSPASYRIGPLLNFQSLLMRDGIMRVVC